MPSLWTNKGAFLMHSGQFDFDAASGVKAMLLKPTYTPSKDDNFISDIVAHEYDGNGYTGGFGGAGRKALASRTVTEDDTNDRSVADAADITWTALGQASGPLARYVAIVQEVTSDADSPVHQILDFGADQQPNGADFIVQFSANGIAVVTT